MPNDRGDFDSKALDRKDLSRHGVRKYSEVKEEFIKINPELLRNPPNNKNRRNE
ncbi:hypothetical protein [Bergeyella sp. RCAD1439]|uniref:hypothetical protein n=1 Tax=Bergeyella anatis TaxID=3113737 RepID=UPI002E19D62B|nr:hypothetical protein [Bergeyella sp. RCAD1439]